MAGFDRSLALSSPLEGLPPLEALGQGGMAGAPFLALEGLPPLAGAGLADSRQRPATISYSMPSVAATPAPMLQAPAPTKDDLIGVDENNVRQMLNEQYHKLQAVTEGWKFTFGATTVDPELYRQLLSCQRRGDYFRAMSQLFRYTDEEIVKLRMAFEMFDEKTKDAAAEITVLQIEVASLREFRNDFLNNRKNFLTKVSDKMTGQQELSAVDRMSLQRSLMEAQRLCKEATSQRAELQLEVSTLDMLNKRLQNKLLVAERRLREAGLTAAGQDSEIYIPPSASTDSPMDAAIMFAPPDQQPVARVNKTSSINNNNNFFIHSINFFNIHSINFTFFNFNFFNNNNFNISNNITSNCYFPSVVNCFEGHVQADTADFTELCVALGTSARSLLTQTKQMANTPDRDWRAFGRTANAILQCVLRIANSSPSSHVPAAQLAQLFTFSLKFAEAVSAFVLVCQNRSVVFDEPPADVDFRQPLVVLIKFCSDLRALQINFAIVN